MYLSDMRQYSLDLAPFSTPGFAPSDTTTEPCISQKIDIVIKQVPGVQPRSFAPPGYDTAGVAGDYNNTLGLLENGNQRFYHHAGH